MASHVLQHLAEQHAMIEQLASDSRRCAPGCVFFAYPGETADGRRYIADALARGASAVVWESEGFSWDARWQVPNTAVAGLKQQAGWIAHDFYGHPSEALWVCGVTGTNGKTSISQLLAQALEDEAPCGIMGTFGYGLPQSLQSTGYTTPDAVTLQRLLADLRAQGAESVTMEVSSHALDQGRATAVHFDAAIFTNLSRDHFDYHGSFEHYAAAKLRLFQAPGLGSAIINLDDEMGERLLSELEEGVDALVYTLDAGRQIPEGLAGWAKARQITPGPSGMEIQLLTHQGEGLLKTRLLGRFNAANLLAVLLVLLQRGWELGRALKVMQGLSTVPGRMQLFGGDSQPSVVVDYAHTPDALEKALLAARVHCAAHLMVVFGCGGDRDRGKRPLMGSLAERLADEVYVTDDNPRSEPSAEIIAEILAGLREPMSARVVPDRGQAIREAIQGASPGDLVLVAGKGHEDYQLVGDLTLHFDDREQVAEALAHWQEGSR